MSLTAPQQLDGAAAGGMRTRHHVFQRSHSTRLAIGERAYPSGHEHEPIATLNEQAVSEPAVQDALEPPPHVARKALRPNDQIVTRRATWASGACARVECGERQRRTAGYRPSPS